MLTSEEFWEKVKETNEGLDMLHEMIEVWSWRTETYKKHLKLSKTKKDGKVNIRMKDIKY